MATNKNICVFAIVLAIVINLFSWDLPFFWDTILTSTITQHFYQHGFGNFISPTQFDAGHPPLFYIYVTCFYHIFGSNLFAAHLSMLPFTILGIVSFIQLLQYFTFSKKQQIFGIVLYFSIPALITQNILVSYDAVLLSLYLAALIAILKDKKILFAFILIGIVGISLRGLFCLISLSITIYFYLKYRCRNKFGMTATLISDTDFPTQIPRRCHPELDSGSTLKNWLKWNLYFIPALLIISIWYLYHYEQAGWLLSTNADGWSNQRGLVNVFGLFKNSISIARCFFDLGVFSLSILSLIYVIQKRKIDTFVLLALIPFLIFSISFLPLKNPINHRYFLIVYVLLLPIVIQFLSNKKMIFSVLTIVILWLGNLQIYPVPISNGWDCTLEYLSYNSCMNDFYFINNREKFVDRTTTGSVFPMSTSLYQTQMTNDTLKLINVNEKEIDSIPFILYSNVGNDFSDEQINQLYKWQTIAQFKHGFVKMILYKNPKK